MPHAPHVLIVEDHLHVRTVLTHTVTQLWPNATIVEAMQGAEALCAISQQAPDLIITDYHMPVTGGLELVRTLRVQGGRMPIVAISANTSIEESILSVGATAFLPKPFHNRTLKELLRTLLHSDEECTLMRNTSR